MKCRSTLQSAIFVFFKEVYLNVDALLYVMHAHLYAQCTIHKRMHSTLMQTLAQDTQPDIHMQLVYAVTITVDPDPCIALHFAYTQKHKNQST